MPLARWAMYSALTGALALALSQPPQQQSPGGQPPRWQRGGLPSGGRAMGGRGRTPDRSEYPTWENPEAFKKDVFTFARIQFDSYGGRFGQSWSNDFPDCDWNFSYRLQELTALNTDPNGVVLRLTDPTLFDYPFIYMSNPQSISLGEEEIVALRKYLLNGGFLMADDFWTPQAMRNLREVMSEVLPNRKPIELTLDHEIFHIVYDLKQIPQVPSILAWRQGDLVEHWHGPFEGDEAPHFWAYLDDAGRIMALFCQNNDIGDGWEREGEEVEYFQQYSEKWSYPLGINIVTYAMTH
jgi:hypothetical protein